KREADRGLGRLDLTEELAGRPVVEADHAPAAALTGNGVEYAGRREQLAVRRKGHPGPRAASGPAWGGYKHDAAGRRVIRGLRGDRPQLAATGQVVELDAVVQAARGQHLAVGGEGQGDGAHRGPRQLVQLLAGGRVHELDHAARPG